MHRTVLLTALVALSAPSARCLAQASSSLPVIRPKLTELGEFRDSTLGAALIPQEASLSPRGTLIAYTTNDDELRIWNVSTHSSRLVLKGWSESIAWSPAGDAIAFAHASDDGAQEQVWTVRLNPVTGESIGSPQRVSLAPTTGLAPQFSPDGKTIAFPRQDSGDRSSLIVVPAAGGTERLLASGFGIRKLRWAVDGSAIYFVSRQDSSQTWTKATLSRVAVSGGAPQLVHEFTGERLPPALSADNRVVTFLSDGLAEPARISDLNGRPLATLSLPTNVRVADWSGQYRLAGVRETHPRGLRVINIADGKSRDLIDSTADVQAATWFEDSRRIAAIVVYGETGVLVTMNADGTGMRRISLASQPYQSTNVGHGFAQSLRVSPDGQYAVYQGPGRRSLELVNLSPGEQRTIGRASVIEPPVWRSDSKTIRYERLADVALTDPGWRGVYDVSLDGREKLVRTFTHAQYQRASWVIGENFVSIFGTATTSFARLDGSPDQLLWRGSTKRPAVVSRDGRTIALYPGPIFSSEPSTHRLILVSLSGGDQRTLSLPFSEIGCENFSPDGRYLYCTGRDADSDPQTLYEVPLDGSKPRVVARFESRERMGVSVLSPDGKLSLHTLAGVRRAAFVRLDFTDGLTPLLSSTAR